MLQFLCSWTLQILSFWLFWHLDPSVLFRDTLHQFYLETPSTSLFNDVHFDCDPRNPPLPRHSIWPKLPTSLSTKWIIGQKCDTLCTGLCRDWEQLQARPDRVYFSVGGKRLLNWEVSSGLENPHNGDRADQLKSLCEENFIQRRSTQLSDLILVHLKGEETQL